MNLIRSLAEQGADLARHWRLILLNAMLGGPLSLLVAAAYLTVSADHYSLQQLALGALASFGLCFVSVWSLLRALRQRTGAQPIAVWWHDHAWLPGAVLAVGCALWSAFTPLLRVPHRRYEVEISSSAGALGKICILEIRNGQGVALSRNDDSLTDLALTGDWTASTMGCRFHSQGFTFGSLKFAYTGSMDEVSVILRDDNETGKPVFRINGRETHALTTRPLQGDRTMHTFVLDRSAFVIWNCLLLSGWLAAILVVAIAWTALSNDVTTSRQRERGIGLIRKHSWIAAIPLLLFILIAYWPRDYPWTPDVAYYLSLAKSIYHGAGYVNPDLTPAIYRGPVFPLLIALSYAVFGEAFRSALILERLFWILTILLSFLLAKSLFNLRAGILASAFILTASVIDRLYYLVLADGILTALMLGLQLLAWDVFKKRRSLKWYALLGGIMGTGYLTKQTALFMVPLPFLLWAGISEFRTRRAFSGVLLYTAVFGIFFLGWMGYVLLAGGSVGQATGDLDIGLSVLSRLRGSILSFAAVKPMAPAATEIVVASSSPLELLVTYYQQDIVPYYRYAILFPIALVYTAYRALWKRSASDASLVVGLLLFASLIPIQVAANFGPRQSLYLYAIVLICIAAMLVRLSALLAKPAADFMLSIAAASIVIIQVLATSPFQAGPRPLPRQHLNYFPESQGIADWVDDNLKPDEKIVVDAHDGNVLHVLTTGNRTFETLNTCIGDRSFQPLEKCTGPYVSLWILNGITNPDDPRDLLLGISEANLLARVRQRGVKYVIVTPRVYSLYGYLKAHPDFEEVVELSGRAIFQANAPPRPISEYPNADWQMCVGEGTSEYLGNLRRADPARYTAKLRNEIEPWMGLSPHDLEVIEKWDGCQFPTNFPGEYVLWRGEE